VVKETGIECDNSFSLDFYLQFRVVLD
jgi:hypothetical protein